LSAPGSSLSHPLSGNTSQLLHFSEQDSPFTPIHFQEPKLEEPSFESISFYFTQDQQVPVGCSSAIVIQPTPIYVSPPPPFTFTSGSSSTFNQSTINQGVNMATPTFLHISKFNSRLGYFQLLIIQIQQIVTELSN